MSLVPSFLQPDDPILQPLRIGPHHFPGIWAYIMPQEMRGLKLPEERRATCMNCPKACYEGFRRDYRCCTYHPRIPNYLIGLASHTPAGQGMIDVLIKKNMLLPEGMSHAPQQWIDYLDDMEHERFGASQDVLCPMLDRSTGYCNVHAFRNSVCSTFFCYKDHGDVGDRFWGDVQTLGSQVEMSLSQWALEQVGFDLPRYFETFDELSANVGATSGQEGWSDEALHSLWGEWYGREKELMQACAKVISDNRDVLWEIANTCTIHESSAFNKAMVRAVPKRLKDQIDPTDLEDDQDVEAARPVDLWRQVLKSYEKLWDLPDGVYEFSARADIVLNSQDDDESQYNEEKPYSLRVYLSKGRKNLDWRMFISREEKEALEIFKAEGQVMNWQLITHPKIKALPSGKGFLAEMLRSKVLVRTALN